MLAHDLSAGFHQRGFNVDRANRQIERRLVTEQHAKLVDDLAENGRVGVDGSKNGQFMLNERMVADGEF